MGSVVLGGLEGVKRSLEVKVGAAFALTRRDGKSSGWKATGISAHTVAIPTSPCNNATPTHASMGYSVMTSYAHKSGWGTVLRYLITRVL